MNKLFLTVSVVFLMLGMLVFPAVCFIVPEMSIAECYALVIGSLFAAAFTFLLSQD